jgi:hypothetical protein
MNIAVHLTEPPANSNGLLETLSPEACIDGNMPRVPNR